jgi:hypothetical protein
MKAKTDMRGPLAFRIEEDGADGMLAPRPCPSGYEEEPVPGRSASFRSSAPWRRRLASGRVRGRSRGL